MMLSTLASSKMLISICTCESSCPSNAATAVLGIILANSSKPTWNLSGNFTLFARARYSTARVVWRRRDWNSLGASGGAGATSAFSSSLNLSSAAPYLSRYPCNFR